MTDTAAIMERFGAAVGLGRYDAAEQILGAGLASAPDDAELLGARADLAYRRDDAAGAVEAARAALGADPEHYSAHLIAARALTGLGRYDEALGHARDVVGLYPDEPECHLVLAHIEAVVARGRAARRAVRERVEWVLSEGYDDADTHLAVARIHLLLGRPASAEPHLRAGLAHAPDHLEALVTLAETQSRPERAAELLTRALALAPDLPEARHGLEQATLTALTRPARQVWWCVALTLLASMWRFDTAMVWGLIAVVVALIASASRLGDFAGATPPGYLRRRLIAPWSLVSMPFTVLAVCATVAGALQLGGEGGVGAGISLLLGGAAAAAVAYVSQFRAWLDRLEDPTAGVGILSAGRLFSRWLACSMLGAIVLLTAFAWTTQPVAVGAVIALLWLISLCHGICEAVAWLHAGPRIRLLDGSSRLGHLAYLAVRLTIPVTGLCLGVAGSLP